MSLAINLLDTSTTGSGFSSTTVEYSKNEKEYLHCSQLKCNSKTTSNHDETAMQLMFLLNLVLFQSVQSFSVFRNLRMSTMDTVTRGRRRITSSHFHCYLLSSLDPKHKQKTYVGFTVSVSYEAVSFWFPFLVPSTYPDSIR
jgi:hypothetical protein